MVFSDVLFYTSIFLMCYVSPCFSKNNDKNICKYPVSWSVKNNSLPCNYTIILREEDASVKNDSLTCNYTSTKEYGTQQEVEVKKIRDGVFNETVFDVRCCNGYFEHDQKRCKKCPANTYGNNCTGVCQCVHNRHCNHTTGECKDGKKSITKDDDNTVFIAVIPSLGLSIFVLIVCIVARERHHRSRKRKKEKSGELPSKEDVADYVDSESVYFEIKDEDVICDSKFECKPNPPERSKNGNSNAIQNYSDNEKSNNDSEECGYLNPYTGLRFARSETNIYRDRKAQEKGEYDVIYSIAKSIHRSESDIESNEKHDETKVLMEGEPERISQNMKRVSGEDHVYFVLEKVNQEPESQETEQEKLLSRRSRSSV